MQTRTGADPGGGARPPRPAVGTGQAVPQHGGRAGLLLAATVVALAWANSPWSDAYLSLRAVEADVSVGGWELSMDLGHWVKDGLIALFIFVIGLEVRRELLVGELTDREPPSPWAPASDRRTVDGTSVKSEWSEHRDRETGRDVCAANSRRTHIRTLPRRSEDDHGISDSSRFLTSLAFLSLVPEVDHQRPARLP